MLVQAVHEECQNSWTHKYVGAVCLVCSW